MSAATRPAEVSEQRPVALSLSTPSLPQDLFAWLPESSWSIDRHDVVRGSNLGTVRVSTFVDSWENPTYKAACSEFVSIHGVSEIGLDVEKTILASADDFIDDNQGDLFEAWEARR